MENDQGVLSSSVVEQQQTSGEIAFEKKRYAIGMIGAVHIEVRLKHYSKSTHDLYMKTLHSISDAIEAGEEFDSQVIKRFFGGLMCQIRYSFQEDRNDLAAVALIKSGDVAKRLHLQSFA